MPDVKASQLEARKRINHIFILSFIAWTATIAGLFFIYYENEWDMALSSAKSAAVHSLRKDLLYREWAAGHGGVYVPATESTQPNPYLAPVPQSNVETITGKKLTLISSGCMNEEIYALGLKQYGIHGHNTSLNPINPRNSPDDWEHKALLSLQNGATEYFGLDKTGGSEQFRYMLPISIQDSCPDSHVQQGYKAGDLGGGIAVSLPWGEFQSSFIEEVRTVGGIHGVVWILGLLGMFGARWMITSQISNQEHAMEALAKSEQMLFTVLQATSVGIGMIKDRVIQWTNDAMLEQTGYSPEELFGHPSRQFYVNDQEYERSGAFMYAEIAAKRKSTIETRFRKKDGTLIEVMMNLSAIDKADLSQGAVFVLMDVTESKKMAHELQENIERMERAEMAAKFGSWEFDLNSRKVRGSKGACHIYGVQQNEMDLETVQKFPLPEYRTKLDEALSALIHDRKPYDIEYKAVRLLDNRIVDVHSIADFNPDANIIWGVIQDVTIQKEAQEALIRSEAKFRMLTENVKDIIWSTDLATKFTYVSPSVKAILGYTPEEMLEKTYFDVLTPDVREKFQSIYSASVNTMQQHGTVPTKTYEVEIIKKDGSLIWVEIVSNPSVDSSRNLLGFQGVTRDISQRKQAEAALRESESKFRSYVESSPIGIYETDSDGIVYSTNNALTSISGYASDELLKRNILEEVAPQHIGKCLQAFETLKNLGKASVEAEVISSGGSTVWIDIHGVKLSDNRYLLFVQDITERKKAEAELKAKSNETLQLMKSMTNGFVVFESVFDNSGEFFSCRHVLTNAAFEKILGLNSQEAIGKTVHDLWSLPDKTWLDACHEVATTGMPMSLEVFHEPTQKFMNCNIYRPWESEDRFCMIFEDITQRKRAQEELLEMERKLLQSQKLESLGVLAGGIAHDFNNLLAVIIGNIELAQESDFNSPEKSLFLDRAMSASLKSAALIRQMLDYSGKGAFEFSEVNLSDLVSNNIDMFRMTVPKNVNLRVESSDDDIFVKADAGQIQQVIVNLLINASEAIDGKTGTVEITTGAQYCDESIISRSLLPEKPGPGDMAFVRVRDDGSGMDAETVKRIFDPFFSTKFVGRGLGMSVVHGVVRGHKGAVTIESRPGIGTIITVYLPLLYRKGQTAGEHDGVKPGDSLTEEKSPDTRKLSVLVVDDEQEVLDLVLRQLDHLGCHTLSAMNGKEALEVFNRNPQTDLVILDLVMPEMGGVETFDRLKDLKPDLAVAICSGYNEDQIRYEFKSRFKPMAFLSKPYRLAALKDLIEALRDNRPLIAKEPLR